MSHNSVVEGRIYNYLLDQTVPLRLSEIAGALARDAGQVKKCLDSLVEAGQINTDKKQGITVYWTDKAPDSHANGDDPDDDDNRGNRAEPAAGAGGRLAALAPGRQAAQGPGAATLAPPATLTAAAPAPSGQADLVIGAGGAAPGSQPAGATGGNGQVQQPTIAASTLRPKRKFRASAEGMVEFIQRAERNERVMKRVIAFLNQAAELKKILEGEDITVDDGDGSDTD